MFRRLRRAIEFLLRIDEYEDIIMRSRNNIDMLTDEVYEVKCELRRINGRN